VLKQVVSGLNEISAAGCSLLGYKEIKDLYHHGYAGTLKLVMEALLNNEATGEARVLLSSAKLWWRCASPTASCGRSRWATRCASWR